MTAWRGAGALSVHGRPRTTGQAERDLLRRLGLPGAELVLDDDRLSALVGHQVAVSRVRVKESTSAVAAWSGAAGDGWVGVFSDAAKVAKALERAEEVKAELWSPFPGVVVGEVASDTPLARPWRTAQAATEGLTVVRHNPRRRIVARAVHEGVPVSVRVASTPVRPVVRSTQAWLELGAPVLPLERLPGCSQVAVSPWWGEADLMTAGVRWAAREAGHAIAAVHEATRSRRPDTGGSPLDQAVHAARALTPWWGDRIEAVAKRLGTDRPRRTVLLHGDLSPDQVLVGGSEIRVIDLDRSTRGAATRDIGRFLSTADEEVGAAFMEGYRSGSSGRPLSDEEVVRARARALVETLPEGFRTRDPEWLGGVELALAEAEGLLR